MKSFLNPSLTTCLVLAISCGSKSDSKNHHEEQTTFESESLGVQDCTSSFTKKFNDVDDKSLDQIELYSQGVRNEIADAISSGKEVTTAPTTDRESYLTKVYGLYSDFAAENPAEIGCSAVSTINGIETSREIDEDYIEETKSIQTAKFDFEDIELKEIVAQYKKDLKTYITRLKSYGLSIDDRNSSIAMFKRTQANSIRLK